MGKWRVCWWQQQLKGLPALLCRRSARMPRSPIQSPSASVSVLALATMQCRPAAAAATWCRPLTCIPLPLPLQTTAHATAPATGPAWPAPPPREQRSASATRAMAPGTAPWCPPPSSLARPWCRARPLLSEPCSSCRRPQVRARCPAGRLQARFFLGLVRSHAPPPCWATPGCRACACFALQRRCWRGTSRWWWKPPLPPPTTHTPWRPAPRCCWIRWAGLVCAPAPNCACRPCDAA